MSTPAVMHTRERLWLLDDRRGTWGMYWFIATEAMLFALLFLTYFYLRHAQTQWPTGPAPALKLSLPMTAILLSSSFVLHRAETLLHKDDRRGARAWVLGTILMGIVFIGLQVLEYRNHLKIEKPTDDAYTSIFYTITSIHGVHVVLGLLMLGYVLLLPVAQLEPAERPPHRSLHNASLYWHFVDLVWLFIISVLYIAPHFRA